MINLDFNVLIDCPPGDVFAFVADPNNFPKWQSQVVAIQQLSNGPIGVGSTFQTTVEAMGRRIEGKAEVTTYQPDSLFAFKMDAGPMQINATANFKPAGTGTHVSLNAQGEPGGLFKLAEGMLVKQMQSLMNGNLAKLKSILEAG